MASVASDSVPSRSSVSDGRAVAGFKRKSLVRLAWGSKSHAKTRLPCPAQKPANWNVVVVFPTPPLWFATAMIRLMGVPE